LEFSTQSATTQPLWVSFHLMATSPDTEEFTIDWSEFGTSDSFFPLFNETLSPQLSSSEDVSNGGEGSADSVDFPTSIFYESEVLTSTPVHGDQTLLSPLQEESAKMFIHWQMRTSMTSPYEKKEILPPEKDIGAFLRSQGIDDEQEEPGQKDFFDKLQQLEKKYKEELDQLNITELQFVSKIEKILDNHSSLRIVGENEIEESRNKVVHKMDSIRMVIRNKVLIKEEII
jgi:hypothetical protein